MVYIYVYIKFLFKVKKIGVLRNSERKFLMFLAIFCIFKAKILLNFLFISQLSSKSFVKLRNKL